MKKVGIIGIGVIAVFAALAQATAIDYGNLNGVTVLYQHISEDSTTDSVALFGAPGIAGDALTFNPVSFGANASGAGGFDITDGTLAATVQGINNSRIEKLQFSEQGDYTLAGNGTAATNVSVGAALFVTVTEVEYATVNPISANFNLIFNPSDGTYNLVENRGMVVIWNGSVLVDIDAMVAAAGLTGQATKLNFTLDNQLLAFSEAGTVAYIKKKEIEGLSVTAITPEPTTIAFLLVGGLFLRRRA